MRRVLLILVLALLAPASAWAQIAGPPFVFTNGTVIDADEVNANFSGVYAAACNRTGCTLTGPLLFSPDNTIDIGASGTTRPRDLWLGRNATIGGTLSVAGASTLTGAAGISGVLTVTTTTSPQIVARYDASNRLETSVGSTGGVTFNAVGAGQAFAFSDPVSVPAFASSGAGTITGAWQFTVTTTIANTAPRLQLTETDATVNEGKWWLVAVGDDLQLQTLNDAENSSAVVWTVTRTGTTVNTFAIAAAQTLVAAGSGGAPSLSFSGDPDTGIYNPVANTVRIVANGGARFDVNTNGVVVTGDLVVTDAIGYVYPGELAFAALGTPGDGALVFCSDCTVANPCAGAGTGALAKRLAGAWRCN